MYDWVGSFVSAVGIILVLFTFFVRPVRVSGESMRDTLQDRDWVVVSGVNFELDYGDIVVVNQKDHMYQPLIKRVIARSGDVIDFHADTNEVYVQKAGQNAFVLLQEPYILDRIVERHHMYDMQFPYEVPEGCVFVMGDNRNNSKDSRMIEVGAISEKYVMGKALFRVVPFGQFDIYKNYEGALVYGEANKS